ncbi:hypothetical protein [Zhongshania aliphaticivorans]|nr:hypothetical protein [Zhongshania aliphaticivorans]
MAVPAEGDNTALLLGVFEYGAQAINSPTYEKSRQNADWRKEY